MREKLMNGYDWIVKYFMYFICAAVVGWIYEVLTIMLENHHGFQNRGVLFGPYLPIYGFGMLIVMATVNPIRKMKLEKISSVSTILAFCVKFILAFIAAFVVTSLVELVASYIISPTSWEYVENGKNNAPWFYSAKEGYDINFQGRIALKSSLRFGIGSMFLLYGLQPLINKFSTKAKAFKFVGSVLLLVFVIDCIVTFVL
ncbi:MAG: putative ABC transporter permease [Eubacterium sp.]|nr:putative ABC transporter permease [Eubacterium sp.]